MILELIRLVIINVMHDIKNGFLVGYQRSSNPSGMVWKRQKINNKELYKKLIKYGYAHVIEKYLLFKLNDNELIDYVDKKHVSLERLTRDYKLLYNVVYERGLLQRISEVKRSRFVWTRENMVEEAKKFKNYIEFKKAHKHIGSAMRRLGLTYKDLGFTIHYNRTDILDRNDNVVYAYFDEENKFVYIGRTIDMKRRDRDHHRIYHKTNKYDSVKQYFDGIGKEIPQYVILEDDLSTEDSLVREDYYVRKYELEGWKLINRAATGLQHGSIGGCYSKWSKEKVMEAAKGCSSYKDFYTNHSGAVNHARVNGYLNELITAFGWHVNKQKPHTVKHGKTWHRWTREEVFDLSKLFKSKSSFRKAYGGAFSAAEKNGWIDDMPWLNEWMDGRKK